MKRDAVRSRAFAAQGYDPATQTLEIQYHSGAIWQHPGVPQATYTNFLTCGSMGYYLNAVIKPTYPAVRQPDAVEIWVCGRALWQAEIGIAWELQGIFTCKSDAVKACLTEFYFVGPATLDVNLPAETTEWIGCYYPLFVQESEEVSIAPND
jgi:hypothetical protein